MITILVAFDDNRLIGQNGKLPWNIPEDLALFKQRTMGHTVIMGRKTWEGLPKKPLPGRTNVIISSNFVEIPNRHLIKRTPIRVCNNLKQAVRNLQRKGNCPKHWRSSTEGCPWQPEIYIIGGGQLYKAAMKIANRIIVSKVHGKFEGDTYFPKIGWRWRKKSVERYSGFDVVEYRKIWG
jgi:dihydrofolate reductase